MDKLEPGKTYNVTHSRKGNFTLRVITIGDDWVTGEITEGHTRALCAYNERYAGEEITMRVSFLKAIEEVTDG